MFTSFPVPWGDGPREQPTLEIVRRQPREPGFETPIVFVHGAYVGAWCWEQNFLPHFVAQGYSCVAPSLRGHGGSDGRGRLAYIGFAEYVLDLAAVVDSLAQSPVLVGHSMGGLVIQHYLQQCPAAAAAAVLMASVPPTGIMPSTLRLLLGDPMLLAQMTIMQGMGPQSVDLSVARRAVFSDHIPERDLVKYARYMQPESQRALWEMTLAMPPGPWRVAMPPMLVIGAQDDTLFSADECAQTAHAYGADLHIAPGMAHAMMLEPGWQAVAERIVGWLRQRGVH